MFKERKTTVAWVFGIGNGLAVLLAAAWVVVLLLHSLSLGAPLDSGTMTNAMANAQLCLPAVAVCSAVSALVCCAIGCRWKGVA